MSSSLSSAIRTACWTLTALALPACALTTAAYFTSEPAILAQLSPFRVQYAVLLAAHVLFCLALRHRRMALVFAVFATFNLWAVLRIARPELLTVTEAARAPIKILLANVLTSNREPARLLDLIAADRPDLIALLEVNRRWQNDLSAALSADYPHSIFHSREDNFGLAVLSRRPLSTERLEFFANSEIPSIAFVISEGPTGIRFLLTHPLPPGSAFGVRLRDRQLAGLIEWCHSPLPGGTSDVAPPPPLVLLGDFNATPWCPPIRRLLAAAHLRPAGGAGFANATWPVPIPFLRIPLDHALLDENLVCRSHLVGPDIGSDHLPVVLEVQRRAALQR